MEGRGRNQYLGLTEYFTTHPWRTIENFSTDNRRPISLIVNSSVSELHNQQLFLRVLRVSIVKSDLRNRAQEYVRRSVVRESLADVDEMVHVSRTKNETASQLERIFAHFVLAMPGCFRSFASQAIHFPEQMKQISLLQVQGPISLP